MNKQEFLAQLGKGLAGLPKDDIEERLTFYSEMIDDRVEEGISEEAAVSQIGTVDGIVAQTIAEIPLGKLVKEKIRPKKKLKAWEIILLILGSPIWLSVLLVIIACVLAIYVVLWSVILALWAVFVSLAAVGPACAAAGVYFIVKGNVLTGIAAIGGGMVCAGLAVFLFFGCKAATKGTWALTGLLAGRIKKCFIKKEEA